MQREPTMRDGGGDRRAVFLIAAASLSKLRIDDADRQSTGVIGLYRIRQLKQFSLGGIRRRERRSSLNFILAA
jgi:hypothetical protein